MQIKLRLLAAFTLFLAAFVFMPQASAINTADTKLLQHPAISQNHIAFVYANDLWVANRDGSNPRRLTISDGVESHPSFSPDGTMIAFDGNYDGNEDVYVVPVTGGIPKRLTYHPGFDAVCGFSNDGKSVLFISQRDLFTNRYTRVFAVDVESGAITRKEIPNAFKVAYSPDGKFVAYTPIPDRFYQWKNYRGGTQSRILVMNTETYDWVQIPKPEGGCNDSDPMWMGDKIYFNSDRKGEFNLFSYNPATKEVKQLTEYKDFPVLNPSAGNGQIIYEKGGYIYTYTPGESPKKVTEGKGRE